MNVVDFNARWLQAWSDKDVDRLCAFYAQDCVYRDLQTPAGLTSREALRTYITALFAATPSVTYTPDEVWPIEGGFCGRWYAEVEGGPGLRGFDLVLLRGDEIVLNEVYLHQMPA